MEINVFEKLLIEKIENFKFSFEKTAEDVFFDGNGKLIHPGEFGRYREKACKQFIKYIIPSCLSMGEGFLINTFNEVSHQCDIVIYDARNTPLIESTQNQFFYPIESVAAVGEIKSILSKAAFKETINKLTAIKSMRERVKHPVILNKGYGYEFNPQICGYDQIFTFIICKKLDFDIKNIALDINTLYNQTCEYRHRHNLILSIEDGLLAYYDENKKTMMYPTIDRIQLKNRFVTPGNSQISHFKLFASYLFLGASSATILYPEISDYMGSIEGGYNIDEM